MNMEEFRLHANISWNRLVLSKESEPRNATVLEVKMCAAKAVGLSVKELDSKAQKNDHITGRQLIMYYLKKKNKFSLAKVGRICGGKDHATVLSSNRRYDSLLEANDEILIDARDRFNYELLKISKTINTL